MTMAQMNLNEELINDLQAVIVKHDPQASDPAVVLQYLAAVMGIVLGNQPLAEEQRKSFLNELYQFSGQVVEDVAHHSQPAPPAQEAFGIWRPE